jgi:hypothetical protein
VIIGSVFLVMLFAELAQSQTVAQVHDLALDRGKKMRALGITIDFAPVDDVTDAPDGVIGDRSFGGDPATVTAYAGPTRRVLSQVVATAAHNPRHAWTLIRRSPDRWTTESSPGRAKSTSQAEYAGSIPVIGSTSSLAAPSNIVQLLNAYTASAGS